ncbi:hypothetical protein KKB43_01865 [Patescibacteria group bacterium]|nr:hypothetical protein [Patescibacteria group bacterium]
MFLKTANLSKLIIFIAIIGFLAAFAAPVSAQVTGLTDKSIPEIIAAIIDWLLSIAAGLTILFLIVGGIYYVTAAGDENQMTSAKTIITYSIMGLLFILISYSIVITVNSIITG